VINGFGEATAIEKRRRVRVGAWHPR
jgi:hypothetical protein